ncbi:MAG: DNA replication/repair protein RecF, partial [Ktedonobacterales bacterium]
ELADDGTADGGVDVGARNGDTGLRLVYHPSYGGSLAGTDAEIAAGMKAQLAQLRRREIAQGANVLGPHRDDLAFLAGGVDLATYGSRGQQRSVALALKLAELGYIEQETGDQPILLLDDVLSELDARRRGDLLEAVSGLDQVLLTTTDLDSLPDEARKSADTHIYRVRAGQVSERRLPA